MEEKAQFMPAGSITLSIGHEASQFHVTIRAMCHIIAYFDMDYTILDTSSGLLYVRYLRQHHQITSRQLLRVGWWSLLYKLSLIDMARAMPHMSAYAENASATEMLQQTRAWFKDMVQPHLTPAAIERIRWHQTQGHMVVVISASTQFAVRPVAEFLGLDYLCTQLAVNGDRLTGRIVEPACYGGGKIFWAKEFAMAHDAQLSDSYFYTDSLSDLPLLDLVGHPIAINPDLRLKRLAQRRGWPIVKFH